MPAKRKRKPIIKEKSQTSSDKDSNTTQDQINPLNIQYQQNDHNNNPSSVEISSAQAEVYFEYLRKKISHQTNDPFSLPFLNLKFEQLETWKGATEQLNLQSRIYGMRVDNCHDYTIKMLNYVIRNQEEQIGQPITKNLSKNGVQKDTQVQQNQNQQKSKPSFNFNLQKPQKLISTIQLDKNLSNHSLWKVIFKKSETLQKIQLNNLQIGPNLALQIDAKNIKYNKKTNYLEQQFGKLQNLEYLKKHQQDYFFIDDDMFVEKYNISGGKLSIFNQISEVKNDISQEIQEILRNKKEREKNRTESIQQPIYDSYFGFRQVDFDGLYQEFNQFTKYQEDNNSGKNSQKTLFNGFQSVENRFQVFVPVQRELFSIPFQNYNLMNSQLEQFQQQEQDSNDQQQRDLYQPHKDILFHSTIKKARQSKRQLNKNQVRRKNNDNMLIDFNDTALIKNRKNIFKQPKQVKNNIQNDNLIPINYVVLYQNRNPFKRQRKLTRTSNKINIYDNNLFHTQNFMDCEVQNIKGKKSLRNINVSQPIGELLFCHQAFIGGQDIQDGDLFDSENTFRNVSMKTVKNEIKKELFEMQSSLMLSNNKKKRISNFSLISQTSQMDSYLEEEGRRIGLKFLKQKMGKYDPLDILMSMLHVAYENQVLLQPVYAFDEDDEEQGTIKKFQDIIIQGLPI